MTMSKRDAKGRFLPAAIVEPVEPLPLPEWESDLEREVDKILNPPKPVTVYDQRADEYVRRGWTRAAAEQSVSIDRLIDEQWADHVESLRRNRMNEDAKARRLLKRLGGGMAVLVAAGLVWSGMTDSAPAKPKPVDPQMSKNVVGMAFTDAMTQLQRDGFLVNGTDDLTVAPWSPAPNCVGMPPDANIEVVSVALHGSRVSVAVRDTRVCAPVVVPRVNVDLPSVPSYHHDDSGSDGRESRFCRHHWWC